MKYQVETEELARTLRSSMQTLDANRTYHPVFCTTSVPDSDWAQIVLADPVNPSRRSYVEVSSMRTTFESIQQRRSEAKDTESSSQLGTDFLNLTMDRIYDFWKQNLKPPEDCEGPFPLSAFTFVIIDEACRSSNPKQCIVCSDAPDFGESDGALVMKHIRIDASKAWCIMVALEELTMTPRETLHWAENWDDRDFSVLEIVARPPTTVTLVEDDDRNDIERRYATPAEARENKRKAIKYAEDRGWIPLKGWSSE